MKQYKKYCEWALKMLENSAIFIFFDKNYHNFGDVLYKNQYIIWIKRELAVFHTKSRKTIKFLFMYQRAIYINIEIETLMTIFDIETIYKKKTGEKNLEEENKELEKEFGKKQKHVLEPNIIKYYELEEINQNI